MSVICIYGKQNSGKSVLAEKLVVTNKKIFDEAHSLNEINLGKNNTNILIYPSKDFIPKHIQRVCTIFYHCFVKDDIYQFKLETKIKLLNTKRGSGKSFGS